MCLAALSYAKVEKIVYGLNLREVYPKERIIDLDINLFLEKNPNKMEVVRNFMQGECRQLLL